MPEGIAITLPPYESGESIREQSHSQEKSEATKPSPDKSCRLQPVDATLACSLSAGVSNPNVFRGR